MCKRKGPRLEWLEDHKIPIGKGAKSVVDWLTDNAAWFFDGLAFGLEGVIAAILFVLQTPHPFVVIAAMAGLAFYTRRSIAFAVFSALGLLLVVNQGYWEETTETLALVLASTLVCMGVGVPIGIAAARRPWLYAGLRPVLDLMQTIPTFVYLIPASNPLAMLTVLSALKVGTPSPSAPTSAAITTIERESMIVCVSPAMICGAA